MDHPIFGYFGDEIEIQGCSRNELVMGFLNGGECLAQFLTKFLYDGLTWLILGFVLNAIHQLDEWDALKPTMFLELLDIHVDRDEATHKVPKRHESRYPRGSVRIIFWLRHH